MGKAEGRGLRGRDEERGLCGRMRGGDCEERDEVGRRWEVDEGTVRKG